MTSASDLPDESIVEADGSLFEKRPAAPSHPWLANHSWVNAVEGRRTDAYVDDLLAAGAQVLRVGTGEG